MHRITFALDCFSFFPFSHLCCCANFQCKWNGNKNHTNLNSTKSIEVDLFYRNRQNRKTFATHLVCSLDRFAETDVCNLASYIFIIICWFTHNLRTNKTSWAIAEWLTFCYYFFRHYNSLCFVHGYLMTKLIVLCNTHIHRPWNYSNECTRL